jgi:Uncharacterized alpha/beta hydrolase domain (DUF2235)
VIGAVCDAVLFGLLLGVLYAPVRLSGVDFGKWYRDPAEPNEGDDRSWIGQMKRSAFANAHGVSALVVVVTLVFGTHLITPRLVLHFIGVVLGWAISQALVEIAWRFGLRWHGNSTQIRLARQPAVANVMATPRPKGYRRLIVCCDGTWNSPKTEEDTNVVRLLRAIAPVCPNTRVTQISHYHLGVGTGNVFDRLLGGMAGIGLSSSVKSCYGFLVDNYQPGDEILLFGFSRGAYVVRSVAGLIGTIGLLEKTEMFVFQEVWDYYTLSKTARKVYNLDDIAPERHKRVPISCVGVWDTVGALGIPGTKLCSQSYTFHQTSLGSQVRHAFQSLAMDERRGNFQPAVWVRSDAGQVLEQVWFPGVHSDVGGGYPDHGLADATLLWMLGRLRAHSLLSFDDQAVAGGVNRKTAELYPEGHIHDSRSLFWKLVGCPVPRPVGITDESECIHESAKERAAHVTAEDIYRNGKRQAWLRTIPLYKVANRAGVEESLSFNGTPPGVPYIRTVQDRRGLCSFLLQKVFGDE